MSGFLMMISALDSPARGTRQRLRAGPFAPPPSLPPIGRCRIAWRWPLTSQPVVLLLVGQCAAAVVDVVDEGVLLWVPAIATASPASHERRRQGAGHDKSAHSRSSYGCHGYFSLSCGPGAGSR